jgi:hypothetical protein
MATRTSAQDERIATLISVMRVISLVDRDTPRRSAVPEVVNLAVLMPKTLKHGQAVDPWAEIFPSLRYQQ